MPEGSTCRICLSRVSVPSVLEKILPGMQGELSGDGPHSFTRHCHGGCLALVPLPPGSQDEHNAGPAVQADPINSLGAPFPNQGCCVKALISTFPLFNFPSLLLQYPAIHACRVAIAQPCSCTWSCLPKTMEVPFIALAQHTREVLGRRVHIL